MIPKTFHRIWLGPNPIPAEAESLHQGWLAKHPGWKSQVWTDADLGWLRNQSLFDRANSFAQRADIARYEVAYRFGGVFLDTDVECLQSLNTLLTADLSFFAGRQGGQGLVGNALFGSIPNHDLLSQVINCLPLSCFINRHRGIYMQTGPGLLTSIIDQYRWDEDPRIRIFPYEFFYPYFVSEPWKMADKFPTSFAIHYWSHSWKTDQGVRSMASDMFPREWSDFTDKSRGLSHMVIAEASQMTKRISSSVKRRIKSTLHKALPSPPLQIHGVPWGSKHVLVATPLETRLLVPVTDISVAPELALNGVYEAALVDFITRSLRPGMTFVDIGANVGLFTILSAKLVGTGGRVFAYECNPDLVTCLQDNVEMNWVNDRVEIVPKAAGREHGLVKFWVSNRLAGLGSTLPQHALQSHRRDITELEVPCESISERLMDASYIDFIKIDVEGGEAAVLDGANDLFVAKRVGMLCLEFRADILTDEARKRMTQRLIDLREQWNVTFHIPSEARAIPLDEVVVRSHYANLLVRFPNASIQVT